MIAIKVGNNRCVAMNMVSGHSTVRMLLLALLVWGSDASVTATMALAQTYQCATANDDVAFAAHRRVVQVVTAGTDTASVADRAMYNLPKTTASKVSYVTRANKCGEAARRFYTVVGNPPTASDTVKVLVLKVGNSRYVVYSLPYRAGEFSVAVTFDSKWRTLGNVSF